MAQSLVVGPSPLSHRRGRWESSLRFTLLHSVPGSSLENCSPPLRKCSLWCLHSKKILRARSYWDGKTIAKANGNMCLPEDLLWKRLKVVSVGLQGKSSAQVPTSCCITRTALAKGNWARSSSLWRRRWQHSISSALWQTFTWNRPRVVNRTVTSHKVHLLVQVTAETKR